MPKTHANSLSQVLRQLCLHLQEEWGTAPFLTFSCAGYADEHIQIWHPDHMKVGGMPAYVVDVETGTAERHPDSPLPT